MASTPAKHTETSRLPPPPPSSDDSEYYHEEVFESTTDACGCLQVLCFRRPNRSNGYELHRTQQDIAVRKEDSWVHKLKKMQVLASGPEWKNLIRRMTNVHGRDSRRRRVQFQYDPESYALNFDDALDKEEGGGVAYDFNFLPGFAARKGELPGRDSDSAV